MSDKNNIQYWVEAAKTSFQNDQVNFTISALSLKDYFTLTDSQLYAILESIA